MAVAAIACGTDRPVADQPSGSGQEAEPGIPGPVANITDDRSASPTPWPSATDEPDLTVPKPAATRTPSAVDSTPPPPPTVTAPRPFIDVPGVIKSFPDIPPAREADLGPIYPVADEVRQRIAQLAPGFGGMYVTGAGLVIILKDESQIDRTIAAVAAYAGADQITPRVRIEFGNHDFAELAAWYQTARDILWQIDGVFSSSIDEVQGLIEFGVVTEKTADAARKALEGSGIPPEVVVFHAKTGQLLSDHVVNVRSEPGIEIELEAPAEVSPGEQVSLAVVLVNRSDRTIEFIYNSMLPEDIILFQDGIEVWGNKGRIGGTTDAGRISILAPGESVRFETEWAVVNNDLEPLPPGEYVIAAAFAFNEEGVVGYSRHDVGTEPVPLTVSGG